jgi:hypothetical protein
MIDSETGLLPKLDYGDPSKFWSVLQELEDCFSSHQAGLERVKEKGRAYMKAFERLDGLVQHHTARVCPYCGTVCCINRHGMPEFVDVVGMLAMGLQIPRYNLGIDDGAVCQFIDRNGCVLPRAKRPYRCTRYFCEALMVQIEIGPPAEYRRFISDVEGLAAARGDVLEAFLEVWIQRRA